MLHRLLFVLRRRWPLLVLLPLATAAVAFALAPTGAARSDVRYQAGVTIAVNQGGAAPVDIEQSLIEARQGAVAQRAAELLGEGTDPSTIGSTVASSFDNTAFTIAISATTATPKAAEDYANAFANAFVEVNNTSTAGAAEAARVIEATQARDAASAELEAFVVEHAGLIDGEGLPQTLQFEFQQLQNAAASAQTALTEAEAAVPVATERYRIIARQGAGTVANSKLEIPSSRPVRFTFGLILGTLAAVVVVAVVEKLNPRIDDPEHATALIGAPVLAMVPVMGRKRAKELARVDPENFRGPFAEAFRSMRAHLDFRAQADGFDKPPRILVTSATPAEGKSTSSAYLAMSYAEVDRQPIVIGADLRRPTIHRLFGVARTPGLSTRAAVGGKAVPLPEIVNVDPVSGVAVVPSGPSVDRVTGLYQDLAAIAQAGQAAGRIVIVDTPPVMVANDATEFLPAVDWVVIVVRVGRSTERAVRQMMTTLNLDDAKVAGIVMVGSAESADAKRYYYSYYSVDEHDVRPTSRIAANVGDEPVPVTGDLDAGVG